MKAFFVFESKNKKNAYFNLYFSNPFFSVTIVTNTFY